MKAKALKQVLEVDKYYSATNLKLFRDDLKTQLASVKIVVQQYHTLFEMISSKDDVRCIFKTKEALKEVDSKLE
jgi:hypothetical protein